VQKVAREQGNQDLGYERYDDDKYNLHHISFSAKCQAFLSAMFTAGQPDYRERDSEGERN
jgi:hypothetical protein